MNSIVYLDAPIEITKQHWDEHVRPLLFIQLLTYNHVNYIEECIEGMLIQKTTFPVRIVVFDDCSNDGTTEIIKSYAAKYPQLFHLFIQPINTYKKPELRNPVVKEWYEYASQGKYVAKCEGDDYWIDPLKLQKQVDFLEQNEDYAMVFSNAEVVHQPSVPRGLITFLESRDFSAKEILEKWYIPTASVVLRSSKLKKSKYYSVIYKPFLYGDIVLFLSLAELGKIYGLIDITVVYRRHEVGALLQGEADFTYNENIIKHHKLLADIFKDIRSVSFIYISNLYLGLYKSGKGIKYLYRYNYYLCKSSFRDCFSLLNIKINIKAILSQFNN